MPSGNEYSAGIKSLRQAGSSTGTRTANVSIADAERCLILDGMAVEVTSHGRDIGLELKAGDAYQLKRCSMPMGDDLTRTNSYVWVLNDDDTVSKQQVVLGKANQKTLQIIKGLEMGQHVVVAGVSRLRDGMTVEVLSGRRTMSEVNMKPENDAPQGDDQITGASYFIRNKVISWMLSLIFLIGGVSAFFGLGRLEDLSPLKTQCCYLLTTGATPQRSGRGSDLPAREGDTTADLCG